MLATHNPPNANRETVGVMHQDIENMRNYFYWTIFFALTFSFVSGQNNDSLGINIRGNPTLFIDGVKVDGSIQKVNACDSIYEKPDSMASYKNGMKGVLDFISKKINPHLQTCKDAENRIVASLDIKLTIDKNGKVISAVVNRHDIPYNCRTNIQNEFLNMPNWLPAKHKNGPVCSRVNIPISCIK